MKLFPQFRTERQRVTRSRRKRGRERGAVAVEAAIASSLLVILFFGVLEMGSMLRTRAVLTDASREGTRVVAALPRTAGFQNSGLAAIQGVVNVHSNEPVDYVTIYRADPATGLPASGEGFETCFTDCWRYEWISGTGFEQKLGTNWDFDDHQACGGITDTDWVGVYVRGHHRWITGVLAGERTMTDRTVMRFEPMPAGTRCRP